MNAHHLVSRIVTASAFLLAAGAPAVATERPNIVLIVADNMAWNSFGFLGGEAKTPCIDALARDSLTFTRGFVPTAASAPSLASLLTGVHPHQHGITGDKTAAESSPADHTRPLSRAETLPRELASAGYLALHTGRFPLADPASLGFTDMIGDATRGSSPYAIGRVTMEPIHRFIDRATGEGKPFFVWYAPLLPHPPFSAPKRITRSYELPGDPAKAGRLANIQWFDETCGDLLNQLRLRNLERNTIVVLLSAYGSGPSSEGSPYNAGVRTPLLIRWPQRLRPRTDTTHRVSSLDIMPTLLTAAALPVPGHLAGIDLLDPEAVDSRKTLFLANYAEEMAAPGDPARHLWSRTCVHRNWKLIWWRKTAPAAKPANDGARRKNIESTIELFDLDADPGENVNLAPQQKEIVKDLKARVNAWWDPLKEN